MKTAYDFQFPSLMDEKDIVLSDYKGKAILVVNTASKCGFISQYSDLESLYQEYKDKGLIIIGVPSNDFGKQEPGTREDISTVCHLNYGVTFLMAEKTPVTGDKAHAFYKWARKEFGLIGAPKWNFHKYLINPQGQLVDYFHSTTSPTSKKIKRTIDNILMKNDRE